VTLPEDEQAFLCSALAQLEPDARPVFTARMVEYLAALADPGVGDVDRALRSAWSGLWTPPLLAETKVPPRWSQASPFVRHPKRAQRAADVVEQAP
jgi:hypothetical protein